MKTINNANDVLLVPNIKRNKRNETYLVNIHINSGVRDRMREVTQATGLSYTALANMAITFALDRMQIVDIDEFYTVKEEKKQ